ncbi:hypothetical protein L228DRAFT_280770 [Xylona heveae TC161]|uniref:RNA polymerase II subunit B1 CTD phosphatase RPAP2 homolog n=1 Tax=Xylona heveae (strain CBS 132557 / TC161) TaxID=1328760 RepID=A0A165IY32_XYLHT|nr:hypothetical protein L228DRAFT_280770 [Xylona heveae TC161]KZF25533.1 hypothetical protein L228DRAFT_280770 [Xylona heveae TC161]
MSAANASKSILKGGPPEKRPAPQDDRSIRETALYHAKLIQEQKDIELNILEATERLLDFPSTDKNPAGKPSLEDASTFKELLKTFRPSDYDSLVEERNIDGRCGYALCPLPNRKEDTKAKLRILRGNGEGFKVVPKAKLEQWCSEDCARRALYVRVQLSEEPAWLRGALRGVVIDLLDEVEARKANATAAEAIRSSSASASGPDKPRAHGAGDDILAEAMKDLALERGDKRPEDNPSGLADVTVHEKAPGSEGEPVPPSLESQLAHLSIEGYQPRELGTRRQRRHGEEESDCYDSSAEIDNDYDI